MVKKLIDASGEPYVFAGEYGCYPVRLRSIDSYHDSVLYWLTETASLIESRSNPRTNILSLGSGDGKNEIPLIQQLLMTTDGNIHVDFVDIQAESLARLELLLKETIKESPSRFTYSTIVSNLKHSWNFGKTGQSYDSILSLWTMHWLGEQHESFISNIKSKMGFKGKLLIATLSPYDSAVCGQLFNKETISIEEIRKEYPNGRFKMENGNPWLSSSGNYKFWDLTKVCEQTDKGKDFVVIHGDPRSANPEREIVGFTYEYFRRHFGNKARIVTAQNLSFPTPFSTKSPKLLGRDLNGYIYVNYSNDA